MIRTVALKIPIIVETDLSLRLTSSTIAVWPVLIVSREASCRDVQMGELKLRQQGELFVLPYALVFLAFWAVRTFQIGTPRLAYYAVPFIRERKVNSHNPTYLSLRERNAWRRYISLESG